MKLSAILLTLTIVASSFAMKQKWYTYENEKIKMTVKFPTQFKESVTEKEKSTTYKAQMQGGGMLFMVSGSVHKSTLENDVDGLLKTSLNSFVESLKGEIVSTERIELKGTQGSYSVLTMGENESKIEYRVFLKGNKQYQLISAQLESEYDQKTADEFYKSFKIMK